MSAIAIDFGNSNTVIARWNVINACPETLSLPSISRSAPYNFLIPSLLYLKDAQAPHFLVGQAVLNSGSNLPSERLFDQIKRYIAASKGFIPELDGVKINPEFVGQLFLQQIFSHLGAQQINFAEVIFTVPVQAYERYLQWLEQSSEILFTHPAKQLLSSPKRIRTLDEPTAAALGYELNQPGSLVLVVDFGGGTLDLALVRTPRHANTANWGVYIGENEAEEPEKQVEVIAKTGQTIGGEDITQWLVEDVCDRYQLQRVSTANILFTLLERIKIKLSESEFASEPYFVPETHACLEIGYTRAQFEQILRRRGFYRVLQTAIDEIVNRAASRGVLKMDIKDILLVGGCTLIPSVRETIAQTFPRANLHHNRPFEAVARGALMLNHGVRVKDYLFHSYAIRYWHSQLEQWQYQPLFLKGQTYPTPKPVELLLRASQPNQIRIELVIGELEKRPTHSAEVIFDGDRLVTTVEHQAKEVFQPLLPDGQPQAIAYLEPLGQPGSDRLKVLFSISERRQLLITVIDLETQSTLLKEQPVAELR